MIRGTVRRWRRWRHRRLTERMAGPKIVQAFADAHPDAFFVEIGSNDGSSHDHLKQSILQHEWRGIMVEPVPHVFARLRENYGDREGVVLENVAISEHEGRMPFFHLREPTSDEERWSLPDVYDLLGSFSREVVASHAELIPDIEERIVETEVPTMSFESLCRRHGVEGLDLLLVDTEGHDWEIIRHIDLEARRPRLLVFEHFHLDQASRQQAREHLAAHGYELLEEGLDTFCLDARVEDELTRRFRELRPALPGMSAHH